MSQQTPRVQRSRVQTQPRSLDQELGQRLADWIHGSTQDVVDAWAAAVRADPRIESDRSLSYAEFIDHIPDVIEEICLQLRGASFRQEEPTIREEARMHGLFRWRQGYDLEEIMREIAHLRQVLLSFVASAGERVGASVTEIVTFERLIGRTLDEGQIATILTYIGERDRQVADRDLEIASRREESVDLERRLQQSRLEEERGRTEALESAARMKDDFLATLSHELRTPLTAISAWVRILEKDGSPATLSSAIQALERNARVLSQLIDDLLDVSRIIAGKLEFVDDPLDAREFVRAACETVLPQARARNVSLQLQELSHPLPIVGDAGRLHQVVWNLLTNAVRFSHPGGEVRVDLGESEEEVWIAVTDQGMGIDPTFLPYVFDRFRQQDQRFTRWHGGLGLGLSIARTIVEAHGGRLTAFSAGEAKGSRFELRLPKRQDA
jgi:signal transduction histidine kinase